MTFMEAVIPSSFVASQYSDRVIIECRLTALAPP